MTRTQARVTYTIPIFGLFLVFCHGDVAKTRFESIGAGVGSGSVDLTHIATVDTAGQCGLLCIIKGCVGFSTARTGEGRHLCQFDICLNKLGNGIQWKRYRALDPASGVLFLRRKDGSVNFNRLWADYQTGFGDLSGEFWLGLDQLHALTSSREYGLYVTIEAWDGTTFYAHYSNFKVGNESEKYKLEVSGYDCGSNAGDSMSYHDGLVFSTVDNDNDLLAGTNCADEYGGGWWYKTCRFTNPTGNYRVGGVIDTSGINWFTVPGFNVAYSFKKVSFALTP